ncbi:DinB family protein [Dehalococcoidia bacterium]|nr:DinB family protein [Dehalococcoidia bacterium]
MKNTGVEDIVEELKDSQTQLLNTVGQLSEKTAHLVPGPDEWTVAQLLAHIAEIQEFWTAKAILMTKEDRPEITRNSIENDIREQTVRNKAGSRISELLEQCQNVHEATIRNLGSISPSDLQRPGFRGENNPVTVIEVLHSLVEHINEHIEQIERTKRLIN